VLSAIVLVLLWAVSAWDWFMILDGNHRAGSYFTRKQQELALLHLTIQSQHQGAGPGGYYY